MNFLVNSKVIHPKYYKHLKEAAQHSSLGRQKMGQFLADCRSSKVKNFKQYRNIDFNPEFQFNSEGIFTQNLKSERNKQ